MTHLRNILSEMISRGAIECGSDMRQGVEVGSTMRHPRTHKTFPRFVLTLAI